jgi:hypothetical protein
MMNSFIPPYPSPNLWRIYEVQNVSQESKQWIADPKNRICDAPGSWYCYMAAHGTDLYPRSIFDLVSMAQNIA